MCHATILGRFNYWNMKTVVTVIYFGVLILIVDLTTPGILTSECQNIGWINNCREWKKVWCTVIGSVTLGCVWREWAKTRLNSKYPLFWLRFELSSLKLSGTSFINQTVITNKETTLLKFIIFTSLLSLDGLPSFLGFLPKWIVIQAIITNNIAPLATIVVVTSLITLYYCSGNITNHPILL